MRRGLFLLGLALACSSRSSLPDAESRPAGGQPLDFAFGVLDGSVVTGHGTRGRVTAILFVTTYDLPSQIAARRLGEVVSRHVPRVNALAVALEPAENSPLVAVFQGSLGLSYPVAIADRVELRASAAFGTIDRVPMLVLLDRGGREVRRHFGVLENQKLSTWFDEAQN